MTDHPVSNASPSRRDFLKQSSVVALAGTALSGLVLPSHVHAAGSDVLKVGLIGCGGRGTGAITNALAADPNLKLAALGDTFGDQVDQTLKIVASGPQKDKVNAEEVHKFTGFDNYKGVIDTCDVVCLATPPHFRPAHLAYAVEKGKHVFCEKPVAVDGPGVRSVLDSCRIAKEKGLSIVSGLCWRYHYSIKETLQQVHDGAIGEIRAMQCSYLTQGLWKKARREGWSDMEYQVRNWLYFTWLSGDHNTEQHIHSIDKGAWAMHDEPPVSCSGVGGRQTRTGAEYGHIYDHFDVVYEYKNGVKLFSRCRQQDGCEPDVSDHLFGSKGTAHIVSHRVKIEGEKNWTYKGPSCDMYQTEHDELFKSIRDEKPINNGDYMSRSTLMAIMGRMSAYTGKTVTWDQALNSPERLGPTTYEWGPVPTPPVAMPGLA